jgi:CTD kinase subunit alpha
VQPGEKDEKKEEAKLPPPPPPPDPEADDNPFRPPADLRAEDESARKKRKVSADTDKAPTPTASAGAKTEEEAEKPKISFSIKGRASAAAAEKAALPAAPKPQASPELARKAPVPVSPLVQNPVAKSANYVGNTRVEPRKPASPAVRKEKVRKKRLKARPELSDEFAVSESVYFRKTGNESVVGSGTYGKVYKAVHVYTGRMVALKKIRMEGERDGVSSKMLWRDDLC